MVKIALQVINLKDIADNYNFRGPLKTAQMRGAHKPATGAYTEVREDRGFVGNEADGRFSEVPLKGG